MTNSWRLVALFACLPLCVLACGDDDDATGTNTSGNGGGAGSATAQPLDWDSYCAKEEAQYKACPSTVFLGCQTRCIEPDKGVPARVAAYQQCLLARSCEQLDSDDDCYSTAAFSDLAKAKTLIQACGTLQKQCSDAGTPLLGSSDTCVAVYSELTDPTLTPAVQQCLANHQDCATTAACLKDPMAKLQAEFDQEQACEDQITSK